MRIKDWFKARKEKRAAKKLEKLRGVPGGDEMRALDGSEPEMPPSRFTEEYKEFLEREEAAKAEAVRTAERGVAEPIEECCEQAEEAAEELGEKVAEDYREDNGE
jgi:hypothetical protein